MSFNCAAIYIKQAILRMIYASTVCRVSSDYFATIYGNYSAVVCAVTADAEITSGNLATINSQRTIRIRIIASTFRSGYKHATVSARYHCIRAVNSNTALVPSVSTIIIADKNSM